MEKGKWRRENDRRKPFSILNSQFFIIKGGVVMVKAGYKQTEVGVIPEEWDVAYDPRFPTYLRITDISDDGWFIPESKASVNHALSGNYILVTGDLVFARTGASVGKAYLYNNQDGELVFAGFLIRVHPDDKRLDPNYLKHFTQTRTYWNWVTVNSMRSGQPGINGQEYASLPVAVPPTKAEQQAIAGALSDVDELIGSLDKLIDKKRAIKTAAMQQLLTGQTRLPGFEGEWEVKRLGDFGTFQKGSGVRKDESSSGDLPCIRYGEIYTVHDDYIKTFYSLISRDVAATATRLKTGDILFAGSGETKEDIGKCVAFVSDDEAYAGGDIVIFRPISANPLFLGFYLNTAPVNRQKAR
jgi:type I restriction enzyme, S subunit